MVIIFSVPSHGRHQVGANSGVQWDKHHISRIKVTNTKILYLEFNCILNRIFALIGNHP
jgi:hypothetical protein